VEHRCRGVGAPGKEWPGTHHRGASTARQRRMAARWPLDGPAAAQRKGEGEERPDR
jgi:hypothetical protein